jgi:hypothetical protein
MAGLLTFRRQRCHGPVVFETRAVPQGHGIGAEVEAAVLSPFVNLCKHILACIAGGSNGKRTPVGRSERQIPIRKSCDRPTALVDPTMMRRADEAKVIHAGFAPMQPMLDVVAVQKAVVGTSRGSSNCSHAR